MEDALYWIQPGKVRDPFITSKDILMTYLDIVFRYGAAPGEAALRPSTGCVKFTEFVECSSMKLSARYGWDMTGLA